ncbi:biotin/lipoyl-binding protein, partial [Variovorax paradoxus]|uniref:biotin/lipoyl-binding protein n=1 Tax=Variovorax paradoxus TaxID=34073 RepID=UPI001ABCFB66
IAGRVEEILVDEQQAIKAGQPLLRLSSPEYGDLQLKLLEAATALASSSPVKASAITQRQESEPKSTPMTGVMEVMALSAAIASAAICR